MLERLYALQSNIDLNLNSVLYKKVNVKWMHFMHIDTPKKTLFIQKFIQDVCFFIGTDLEKRSITSLAHQWILHQNESPNSW